MSLTARPSDLQVRVHKLLGRLSIPLYMFGIAVLFLSGALSSTWSEYILIIAGTILLVPLTLIALAVVVHLLYWLAYCLLLPIFGTLFLRAQFGISDLIFVIALLGNAEGVLLVLLDDPSAAPLFCPLLGVLILGGAAWGLWAATRVGETRALRRWGLILQGILLPFALFGMPLGLLVTLSGAGMGLLGWPLLLLGCAILVISVYLSCETLVLHRRAQGIEDDLLACGNVEASHG